MTAARQRRTRGLQGDDRDPRVLLAFDPWRSSILLVAGDKTGRWRKWYREAIPRAEQLYETYLKERAAEEGTT